MENYEVDLELEVVAINKVNDGWQIVIENDDDIKERTILVFYFDNETEILGVVNEVDQNDEHKILYVVIDPDQVKNFNIMKTKAIVVYGSL